ncbi:unnamed protein product, partial [Staurois parvus]
GATGLGPQAERSGRRTPRWSDRSRALRRSGGPPPDPQVERQVSGPQAERQVSAPQAERRAPDPQAERQVFGPPGGAAGAGPPDGAQVHGPPGGANRVSGPLRRSGRRRTPRWSNNRS